MDAQAVAPRERKRKAAPEERILKSLKCQRQRADREQAEASSSMAAASTPGAAWVDWADLPTLPEPGGLGDIRRDQASAVWMGCCAEVCARLATPQSSVWQQIDNFIASGFWWHSAGFVWACLLLVLLIASCQEDPHWLGEFELANAALYAGVGFSNFVAFASFAVQWRGLIGSRGLAPAEQVMLELRHRATRAQQHRVAATWDAAARDTWLARAQLRSAGFAASPTLCWLLGASDDVLASMMAAGLIVSSLLTARGLASLVYGSLNVVAGWRILASPVVESFLWWSSGLLYLSFLTVSDEFLGLQSDSKIPEIDFLLGVLAPVASGPHACIANLAVRFLAFREMLGCGICKYYGSKSWRAFTAMRNHYFTQPLPNPLSFYAHHASDVLHGLSVLFTFVVEVVCPYLLWVPRLLTPRYAAWMLFNMLNLGINLTGNYGFIGLLSTATNLSCIDDTIWKIVFLSGHARSEEDSEEGAVVAAAPLLVRLTIWMVLSIYLTLSLLPLAQSGKGNVEVAHMWPILHLDRPVGAALVQGLSRLQKLQRPFRLCNYQGKFSSMQDYRWEPIIEGSYDGQNWQQYLFKYKPNVTAGRPVFVFLHLPRLDWRIWFLPHRAKRGVAPPAWFHALLDALLEGRDEVLDLLARPLPFPEDEPPFYVRCRLDDVTFAAQQGAARSWWVAQPVRQRTPMHVRASCRAVRQD